MKHLFTTLLLGFFFCITSFSQSNKYPLVNVGGQKFGKEITLPWVGGMNSPQFSPINLNNDSLPDLFVFDKIGDKVITFINTGGDTDSTYRHAPQYEGLFPSDLFSWALIRDYNYDNIPDIFTHANAGIRVFKGSYQNGILHFDLANELLKFPIGGPGGFPSNIWTYVDDIPVIADVNRDGDLDILAYPLGFTTVSYYENQTIENPGIPAYAIDSFQFLEITNCWGSFYQGALDNSIHLHASCKGNGAESPSGGEESQRHTGNTLFNFDYDNDGDVDLLNGNIGYDNLAFLQNCGDSSFADICNYDSLFPSCDVIVAMPTYPAGFGLDMNNDHVEDLIVAPNARTQGRDVYNVMKYTSTGIPSCPFEYVTDTFLVGQMFDFGTDSKAVFFDVNGDGLKDIVIGNYGYFRPFQTYKSCLAYLENIGTASKPKFRQVSDDYSNISNQLLIGVHPAFGDLDGDGKEDMLLGDQNGYLYLYKNTGNIGASFPSPTANLYFGIDVGQFAAPFIYDVNSDGLNDLVVGEKNGYLNYYWNFGTTTAAVFHKDSTNANFGGVYVGIPGYDGNSTPFITRDSTGKMLLYVGSQAGRVFLYEVDSTKLRTGGFTLLDSNVIGATVGSKATINVADINGDGKLDYLLGNSRGGITLYTDTLLDTTLVIGVGNLDVSSVNYTLFPNPNRGVFAIKLNAGQWNNPVIEVYNIVGQSVNTKVNRQNNIAYVQLDTDVKGVYIVRLRDTTGNFTAKVLIE